jgi:FHS family L-fucose permease-like MFS transporter
VGGGAWFPPAQGALADKSFTRHSYLVPLVGFIAMTTYAMYVLLSYRLCLKTRRLNHTISGLVVTEASTSGFHIANRGTVSDTVTDASWGKEGTEEKERPSVEKA